MGEERSRRAEVFARIWRENLWLGKESRSGPGSGVARTAVFRAALEAWLDETRPRRLYDAPCGDFHWMRLVRLPPGCDYVGADIVPEMIATLQAEFGRAGRDFVVADIVEDVPPAADAWLCRESLFHLPLADAQRVIANWRGSGIKWFLATTTTGVARNAEIAAGGWRLLNLEIEPFDLGPPLLRLPDAAAADPDKVVGVWRL